MDQILLWIQNYGTPAIIVLIALEYACFPISSELVLPFAGAFGAGHGTPLFLLIIYSSIAGLIGTTFTYLIGRFGGSPTSRPIDAAISFDRKAHPFLLPYFLATTGKSQSASPA